MRIYKVGSGRDRISLKQVQEVALMFGWIDSLLRSLDNDIFILKFTPRRPGSRWSRINLDIAQRLIAEGRMKEPGRRSLGDIDSRIKALESESMVDGSELLDLFHDDPRARQAFESLPPSYRRMYARYVLEAKGEDTMERRRRRVTQMALDREPPLL
jgi:uncharacterized protein YdeI (YjbR/CyaY-like superfamily)